MGSQRVGHDGLPESPILPSLLLGHVLQHQQVICLIFFPFGHLHWFRDPLFFHIHVTQNSGDQKITDRKTHLPRSGLSMWCTSERVDGRNTGTVKIMAFSAWNRPTEFTHSTYTYQVLVVCQALLFKKKKLKYSLFIWCVSFWCTTK